MESRRYPGIVSTYKNTSYLALSEGLVLLGQFDARTTVRHIGRYMFAANSRSKAERAPKLFGHEPKAPSIWETMEADLLAGNA
jgi:hypothetical protein